MTKKVTTRKSSAVEAGSKARASEASSRKAKKAPANKPLAAPATGKKASIRKRPQSVYPTIVMAQVDVGWGNELFIRGEGANLRWDRGIAMENIEADIWQWCSECLDEDLICKFLINDFTWSAGENIAIRHGQKSVMQPTF